tara:strand:+ start:12976 stop:13710 length:735 start_codon:yes stop_codon:yes gene_type:complete
MGSSRFPGKPLEPILGMPMIGHVYKRVVLSTSIDEVYVATCDEEIFDYIESIGGKAVMTSNTHERCTDRTAEAILSLEDELKRSFDIVVMVQGDEPMVTPSMIDSAIGEMTSDSSVNVVNLMARINDLEEFNDPNEVKVVTDLERNALYFSREPIPSIKKSSDNFVWYKQVCIIPFRKSYLFKFNDLVPTPLEEIESVDMMRILEHGEKVKCVETNELVYSVDTAEDLKKVEELMKKDLLVTSY